MSRALRVVLPSDVFPPRSGGAGWSVHALALALIERGHDVTAVVPRRTTKHQGRRTKEREDGLGRWSFVARRESVLGVPTLRVDYWAPRIPIVQNYFRYEHFWPRLADVLTRTIVDRGAQSPISNSLPAIIHAQHVQTAPSAIMAGRRAGAPVVITVRDHWPWDYFSTGLHGDRIPYGEQTWAALMTDLVARLGPGRGALSLPAIPYMLAHVRRRRQALRQAGAVIAVSDYIARRLSGLVAPERLHVIANLVDLAAIDATIATPQTTVPPETPYLLFAGKLEHNKGAHLLVDIFCELKALGVGSWELGVGERRHSPSLISQPPTPTLVVAGSGPLRPELERQLAALGVRVQFLDWVDHDELLRLMAGCELLLFPSAWGEPLSRVPLEASACGAAILAMPTGGTPSIITDGVDGALESTPAGFARRMAALLVQPEWRRALGQAARRNAERRFAKQLVVGQVEELYRSLAA
ncbi:MAG TPA: glycosyltransferase family 4 protein [Roseiflexaceae bacterium]|nr:glycosyltransferase family 4 protein [Roseiflexaceae bacterium]